MIWLRRLLTPLALWAALGLTFAAASPAALPSSGGANKAGVTSGYRLYRLDQSRGTRLIPMNPSPLTPLKRGRVLVVGRFDTNHQLPQVLTSGDGRTVVVVRRTDGSTRVLDARTGKARGSFRLPATVEIANLALSRDGSMLTTSQKFVPRDPNQPETWYALSTRDGRIVSKVLLTQPCCVPALYDRSLGRLFALQAGTQSSTTAEPGPTSLVAYDAGSGKRVRSLPLEGVRYGSWRMGTAADGEPSIVGWTPGFALSPNGLRIAIFDDSTGRLTVLNAASMSVLRTEHIARAISTFERVATLLGLAPTPALAKEYRGASVEMRYSPDARLLYVTGNEYLPGVESQPHSIGIRAIDIATHQLIGESLNRQALWWMQPDPDGSAVYTVSPMGADAQICPCVLRRHDPTTLRVLAKTYIMRYANPQFYVLRTP